MKYRINARWIEYAYIDIEADSEEQALELAQDADLGDFVSVDVENTRYEVAHFEEEEA